MQQFHERFTQDPMILPRAFIFVRKRVRGCTRVLRASTFDRSHWYTVRLHASDAIATAMATGKRATGPSTISAPVALPAAGQKKGRPS
jgi:hypothetical protein